MDLVYTCSECGMKTVNPTQVHVCPECSRRVCSVCLPAHRADHATTAGKG